uniref:Mirror-image polydactyly 1 n=2 Tax=Nothobranchius korthausae TaxID=1143690 RepID=A0A1A8HH96_9TELE
MYRANPSVNVELRQRLPVPYIQDLSAADRIGTSLRPDKHLAQAHQHFQETPVSFSPSPVSHLRSLTPESPLPDRSPVTQLSYKFQRDPGDMEADLLLSRDGSPWPESSRDGGIDSRGGSSPILRRHLVTAADSSHQSSSSARLQSLDRDKNISFLLKELDALRELNNKLQEELVQKEKKLQEKEVNEELKEEQREAQRWERPTLMLEEVLAAQKNRDQALISRLLLANEERDEALLHARQLQQTAQVENICLQDSDVNIYKLLQNVCEADSVLEIQQFGSVLIQHLRLARQRRDDITAQEMKAVMEDRDKSVVECKRMEEDLLQQRDQWASQEELLKLQRERDAALEDKRQLEAELQVLQVHHSSQSVAASFQPLLLSNPDPPLECSASQKTPSSQVQTLLVQLQQVSREKQSIEEKLQRKQEAEQEASEKVRRLERLVEVLRKKVGTGSLRVVV